MANSILRNFQLVRKDETYDRFARDHQAKTPLSKCFYLAMHLLPGVFGVVVINNLTIYNSLLAATGLTGREFQFVAFMLVTYGWHIVLPFVVLRWIDRLSFRETLAFLGLDRIDLKGIFLYLPLIFVPYTVLFIPYFRYIYGPLFDWLASVPAFQVPEHSIFFTGFLDFPPTALLLLLIGNFLGEELYYRGYLMKKCAFLGRHTWWITTTLFVVYHFWQIPNTYSLLLPGLIFGLVMVWRKDLYVVIVLHFLLNLFWVDWMEGTFTG